LSVMITRQKPYFHKIYINLKIAIGATVLPKIQAEVLLPHLRSPEWFWLIGDHPRRPPLLRRL